MTYVLLGVLALISGALVLLSGSRHATSLSVPAGAGGTAPRNPMAGIPRPILGGLLILVGLFLLASTSFVHIDARQGRHLKRIYAFQEPPPSRIIVRRRRS